MNIPSNNNNQLSVSFKVHLNNKSNPVFNCDSVNEHVSPSNSDVGIPTKIKDIDIPQNINDNQHKNVNIPSINVDIPSFQTNLPNYNPSSIYQYKQNVAEPKVHSVQISHPTYVIINFLRKLQIT